MSSSPLPFKRPLHNSKNPLNERVPSPLRGRGLRRGGPGGPKGGEVRHELRNRCHLCKVLKPDTSGSYVLRGQNHDIAAKAAVETSASVSAPQFGIGSVDGPLLLYPLPRRGEGTRPADVFGVKQRPSFADESWDRGWEGRTMRGNLPVPFVLPAERASAWWAHGRWPCRKASRDLWFDKLTTNGSKFTRRGRGEACAPLTRRKFAIGPEAN